MLALKTKLLIVDSAKALHERVTAAFCRDDYELVHAYNAAPGLRLLRLDPKGYDAVVLGDSGVGHDALAFLAEADLQIGRGAYPPVVLLWSFTGVKAGARARGVRYFAEQGGTALELRTSVRAAVADGWRQTGRPEPAWDLSGACECGARYTSFPEHHSAWCPACRP